MLRRDRAIHSTGDFVTIESDTGSKATSYTDDTVEPEKRYVYRVMAVNDNGASKWSRFERANTPAAPTPEPTPAPTPEPTPAPERQNQLPPRHRSPRRLPRRSQRPNQPRSPRRLPRRNQPRNQPRPPRLPEPTPEPTPAPTPEPTPEPNTPATGAPTISGTVEVGETLTADTSGIYDADGLDDVAYSYQWLADDADTAGAAGGSYTLVDADVGKAIKVRVGFTDDGGNPESLTSTATAAVAVPAADETEYSCPIWSATLTVGRVGENYGYQSFLNPQAGSLIPNSFVLDGVTYTVGSIETAADYFTAFGVDRELPVGFTLELDGAQFESSDASLWSLSYGHVYTWLGRGMDWDVGEEVAVSLILRERVENTPQTGGPAICGTPNFPAIVATITSPTSPILAPFNLTAQGSEGSGVSLSWDAPQEDADSVTGYQVLRGQGDGELETLVGDTQSADTTYTDTAVSGDAIDLAAYRYQVKALRNGEASLGSNVADVLVSQLAHQTSHPGPVQNLKYTGAPSRNATLVSWKGPRFDGGAGGLLSEDGHGL